MSLCRIHPSRFISNRQSRTARYLVKKNELTSAIWFTLRQVIILSVLIVAPSISIARVGAADCLRTVSPARTGDRSGEVDRQLSVRSSSLLRTLFPFVCFSYQGVTVAGAASCDPNSMLLLLYSPDSLGLQKFAEDRLHLNCELLALRRLSYRRWWCHLEPAPHLLVGSTSNHLEVS